MLRLVEPTAELRAGWLEAHLEWGPGLHEDGFGIRPSDELASETGFSAWLERLEREGHPAITEGYQCHYRWIVDGDSVVGGIALRVGDDEYVRQSGHIGYGVRPSARGKGVASWALGEILRLARANGLERALLVCETDNEPSVATITRNGGVREDAPLRAMSRYWIDLREDAGRG
ncbi:GNAT family N-acetyltransferase [Glaciihabitans arcticus]|uniref:GNAT family N-acetyltransferase n=1 Tax=Glaciihabitans arcticus TaxID=2668039 RepID=A0A4V2JF69_9MICO|nr:GNAT family N-acetyltransferase [Glaciihabitans arcticus]TBN58309.1 GNAT family N-acetyltransferase [Glaciihabitans arcticus]